MPDPVDTLLDLPHADARRLLSTGAPVFLTVNPVEFHGPHLSLHNDRLVSTGMARELHARWAGARPEWPFLLADDLEMGVEPCPGPGTRAHGLPEVRAAVERACAALADLGARRVVILTFHGSPLHGLAVQAGVDLLLSRGVRALAPFHVVLRALTRVSHSSPAAAGPGRRRPCRAADPDVDGGHPRLPPASAPLSTAMPSLRREARNPSLTELEEPGPLGAALDTIADPRERKEMARDLALDFHAGFFETSVALHYAPETVSPRHVDLPPCPPFRPHAGVAAASRLADRLGRAELARELRFAAAALAWIALRPFPGYTGRPHLANAAAGAVFARHMVDLYEREARAVIEDGAPPPRPILTWLGGLTLGGRLPSFPRPRPDEIVATFDG